MAFPPCESLAPASLLAQAEKAYIEARRDPSFRREFHRHLREYAGRQTPLYFAESLTARLRGARIYLKREDLCHTGAHKINNTIGQVLLAKRLGKSRVIAETGAGQHGVATATAAALFGLPCVVYMGEEDTHRQAPNVARMHLLGAEVVGVGDALPAPPRDRSRASCGSWVVRRSVHHLPLSGAEFTLRRDRAGACKGDEAMSADPVDAAAFTRVGRTHASLKQV